MYTLIETKEAELNEQVGIPTLGFVLINVAQMRGFIQPGTRHHAPSDHFLGDRFGLVWAGATVERAVRNRDSCSKTLRRSKDAEIHSKKTPWARNVLWSLQRTLPTIFFPSPTQHRLELHRPYEALHPA